MSRLPAFHRKMFERFRRPQLHNSQCNFTSGISVPMDAFLCGM